MNKQIHEVRYYNGVKGFDDKVIYQANFVTVVDENMHGKKTERFAVEIKQLCNSHFEDGTLCEWHESNKRWLRMWFPQIVTDVKDEPVDGWKLWK